MFVYESFLVSLWIPIRILQLLKSLLDFNLAQFGSVWLSLAQFGLVWLTLAHFGSLYVYFGTILLWFWVNLVWLSLNHFKLAWFSSVLHILAQFGSICSIWLTLTNFSLKNYDTICLSLTRLKVKYRTSC